LTREILQNRSVYKAVGCSECLKTGYAGRLAIHEVMMISDNIREYIIKNSDAVTIRKAAMKEGMVTLREAAIKKMLEGVTSFEEVMMLTQEDTKREV